MNFSVDHQGRRSRRRNSFQYKINDADVGDDAVAGHNAVVVAGDDTIAGDDAVAVSGDDTIAGDDAVSVAGDDGFARDNSVAGDQVCVGRDRSRLVPYSNTGVGQERGKGSRPWLQTRLSW